MSKPKTKVQETAENNILSAAIMHAIDTASNFQLYSYRVVDATMFVHRTNELSVRYNQILKENSQQLPPKQ